MNNLLRFMSIALILMLCSCASESDKEAYALYEKAQAEFNSGNFEKVISDLTKAISLTDDQYISFTDGSVYFLRGRANDALDKHDATIVDYTKAIEQGNKHLSSYVLNSDPKPYAKNIFMKNNLSRYYKTRGELYRKLDRLKLAEDDFAVAKRLENLPTSTKERMGELLGK